MKLSLPVLFACARAVLRTGMDIRTILGLILTHKQVYYYCRCPSCS
jgi:hypothetical protein